MKAFKKHFSAFAVISALLAAISFVIFRLCTNDASFADRVNSSVGAPIRAFMASVSNLVGFSVFELLVCLIPIALTLFVLYSVRVFKRGYGRVRFIFNTLSAILIVYSFYVFSMGIGYHTTDISERIGLDEVEVTGESLYRTTELVISELNSLADEISFDSGESRMGYSLDELSKRISDAYSKAEKKYPIYKNFESRAKPIRQSGAMSTLRLLGIYTFYTGESNVNVAYPDFDRPFTVAHEFAHQRGIMRENEANFMAFLVCISSEDPYIRYSGYLRLYEYLSSALYSTDKELWERAFDTLDRRCIADIRASNAVTKRYGDTFIGDISNAINDFYLKQNGTDGVVSYGLVTRLAVAYYESQDK